MDSINAPLVFCNWAATSPKLIVPYCADQIRTVRTSEEHNWLSAARSTICSFFGVKEPERVIFGSGATDLLNKLLFGSVKFAKKGILTTILEHNSVLRPLYCIRDRYSVPIHWCYPDEEGVISLERVRSAIEEGVGVVVISHASNVTGVFQPIQEVIHIAQKNGVKVIVDAAQTGGRLAIDLSEAQPDAMVFAVHKGFMGMTGLGFMILKEGFDPDPVVYGGTGAYSELEDQPEEYPYRLEAGTPNTMAIAHLLDILEYFFKQNIFDAIRKTEEDFLAFEKLTQKIPGIRAFGFSAKRLPFINILLDSSSPEELAFILRQGFGMIVRHGLHCAPLLHRWLGTFPRGTVRLSFGYATSSSDLEAVLYALRKIAG